MQFASPSDDSLASTDVIMHGLCPVSPYPVKHYRGFMLPLTREFGFLAVCECKRVLVGKKLSHVKYSSKRSDFLRFYDYLCYVIDNQYSLAAAQAAVEE